MKPLHTTKDSQVSAEALSGGTYAIAVWDARGRECLLTRKDILRLGAWMAAYLEESST
jgi:hypothetical protein